MKLKITLALVGLFLATSLGSMEDNFMDCPENGDGSGFFTECCESEQLPNDCECFSVSYGTDFTNSAFHLPWCPEELEARFYYHDRSHVDAAIQIQAGASSIQNSPFDGGRKTVFVTHGFADSWQAQWVLDMKDALLEAEDLNVILIDWEKGAKSPNYFQAVANSRTVGALTGRLIQDLNTFAGASFDDVHLVGHSLGAHVMGYAGKEVFRITGNLVARISGLDPAGPAFEYASEYVRLDHTDAAFVDVTHTDAESLFSSGFGIRAVTGHVDFFPNGGAHQPGCPSETFGIFALFQMDEGEIVGACSHMRAPDLFTFSISTCHYRNSPPDSECIMGYNTSSECRGTFSPTTTDTEPYC